MATQVSDPAFAADPVAAHSGQFPLACPAGARASSESPSAAGVRPWGLRNLESGRADGLVDATGWVFDRFRQITVDGDGVPVMDDPPSAKSVSNGDGHEGPNEDWQNDYCPDDPFEV